MAASMRLLARLYINAPKTQTAASLLGGRSNYSKEAEGSVHDDEEKGARTQQSDENADALVSAIRNVSKMSSDPQQARKVEKDLQERLQDIPRFPRQVQASNSIVKRLLKEAAETTRNLPGGQQSSESRTRPSHVRAADGDGKLLVDRQRSAAVHRATSANSSSRGSIQEIPSSSVGLAIQHGQQQQQVPSSLARQGSVKVQLMNEQRLASRKVTGQVPRSRPGAADVDRSADGRVARRSLDPVAVEPVAREMENAPASVCTVGVSSAASTSSSSGTSASTEDGSKSERVQPHGESLMAQLLRQRAGSTPRAQRFRAGAAASADNAPPSNSGDSKAGAIVKQFSEILTMAVHESAVVQADETKKSLSILEQLMSGPRTDKMQPRSFASGGHKDRVAYKLFEGDRLNIFRPEKWPTEVQETKWNSLWASHISDPAIAAAHLPPSNAFEEHIQWTREGKLWTFPIDNEAGMEQERSVPFYEHVFLEKHLVNFPKKGPVRHFMELVVNGLSKNPFVTVDEKVSHIKWFEKYFSEKKNLLDEHVPEQQHAAKETD